MKPCPKPKSRRVKEKTCANKACRKKYQPHPGARLHENWCSHDCAIAILREKQEKEREKKERALKLQWKREASESRSNYRRSRARSSPERQAQEAVNTYILTRDTNKPCIVHGWECPHAEVGFHAGHFRAVGAHPELRYNTWNIHKQCGVSNSGSQNRARWGSSTDQLYEKNLITRIGQARVDWLKGPHAPLQPDAEYLKRVNQIFRKRVKHLKKLRGYN